MEVPFTDVNNLEGANYIKRDDVESLQGPRALQVSWHIIAKSCLTYSDLPLQQEESGQLRSSTFLVDQFDQVIVGAISQLIPVIIVANY